MYESKEKTKLTRKREETEGTERNDNRKKEHQKTESKKFEMK